MIAFFKYVSGILLTSFLLAGSVMAAETLDSVLARMDEGASKFRGMTAHIKMVSYTAVIDDTTVEEGSIVMQRNQKGDTNALLTFQSERDPRTVSFHDKTVDVYFPKIKLVQSYDLGKKIKAIDQYLLLGFGTSGKDLRANYDVTLAGTEDVNGQSTAKLQLIPKSKDVLQNLVKVEIWIAANGTNPVQQKFYRPSKDYSLITYTNYKENPPLTPDSLKLRVPPGVKRERP